MPPLLTVIVPVYNEARTIDEVLRRVLATGLNIQIVVVDDGSTDGTADRLRRWLRGSEILQLAHDGNRGKGSAIRTALAHAEGTLTIIQDADLELDPAEYSGLLDAFAQGAADVVYGSRYMSTRVTNRQTWSLPRLGTSVLNLIVRVLYGVNLTDMTTCYKVLPTSILRSMNLECQGFEFEAEVTAKAARLGLRIKEVPINYCRRSRNEGKKLRLSDGWKMLVSLYRYRHWETAQSRLCLPERYTAWDKKARRLASRHRG